MRTKTAIGLRCKTRKENVGQNDDCNSQMESVLFLVQRTTLSGYGIRRLARHWVPHSEATQMWLTPSQSHWMESEFCQVQKTLRSMSGMWRLVRNRASHSKDTLAQFGLL